MQYDEALRNYTKLSKLHNREDVNSSDQSMNDEDEVNFDIIPRDKKIKNPQSIEFNFDKRSIIDLLQD